MTQLLITSSILIIIVAILRVALKNKLSRRIRYALWGLVVLRLLLPFSLFTSPISAVDGKTTAAVQSITQNIRIAVQPKELYSLEEYAQENNIPLEQAQVEVSASDFETASVKRQTVSLETLLKWSWVGGAAAAAVWFFTKNTVFYIKLLSVRIPVITDCKLKVYRADFLHSPCLFGLLKPAVYLNKKALADENTTKSVLTHELCHYQHGDNLWSFVRCILLAVYWFDPFVWMAAAMSRTDCELACDEAAVNKLGEENRIAYGKALVGMIEVKQAPVGLTCAATTMVSGKNGIKERVKMIANNHKTRAWAAVALVLVMVLAIGCTFGTAKPKEPVTASEMTVAGIKLGMTTDEVTKLLGEPVTAQEKKISEDSPYTYLIWQYDGLKLGFAYTEANGDHLLSSVTVSDASCRLPSGLKVGANYEKVLRTYAKGEDYGELNSDYSADLMMFDADEDSSSLFRLITGDPTTIPIIYRNLADGNQTGSGTAYFSKTYAGGMINYCWYPSDSDAFLVLSFIFDENGKVTKISFGDAEKNLGSWGWQSGYVVTPDDMAFGELKLGLTMDEVRAILGEPTSEYEFNSDELESDYHYGICHQWRYDEDLILNFCRFEEGENTEFKLVQIGLRSNKYALPNGLTTGAKMIEVTDAYSRDENCGHIIFDYKNPEILMSDLKQFAYYLYGGFLPEESDAIRTEAVGTAYVSRFWKEDGLNESMVYYVWCPEGSLGKKGCYSLRFNFDPMQKAMLISIRYYPTIYEN